jgi:mRNA-degrading endonuclease RelE of RelBE toxin-antitoxin system
MSRGRRSRSLAGSQDLRRLRAGRYRVFYTIDKERRVVQIDHVARLP